MTSTSSAADVSTSKKGVELVGVSKSFGPVRALTMVSARFELGEVTAVLGANGSGKSTLLAIVGTLARPTTGKILHGAVGDTREKVRARLGWLGHDSLCYADLTSRENLTFAARLYDVNEEEAVARATARFELSAFLDRPFRMLSRGQRQRVALSRALVHQPLLLLLDEPTTGLDAAATERLKIVVREEADRGSAVVVVTHDAAFAADVAKRSVRLDRGRVVAG